MGRDLDEKMSVKYFGGVEEKERRKKKRKEAFMTQVKSGVRTMQVPRYLGVVKYQDFNQRGFDDI